MELLILYLFSALILYSISVKIKFPELKKYSFIPGINVIIVTVTISVIFSAKVTGLIFEDDYDLL